MHSGRVSRGKVKVRAGQSYFINDKLVFNNDKTKTSTFTHPIKIISICHGAFNNLYQQKNTKDSKFLRQLRQVGFKKIALIMMQKQPFWDIQRIQDAIKLLNWYHYINMNSIEKLFQRYPNGPNWSQNHCR